MDEQKLSLRDFAEKCREGDRTLIHTWIDQLVHGRMARAPELWRLRALATGMGVPVRVLTELAASQWLGVQVADVAADEETRVLVTIPKGLSSEAKARFIRIAEDIARHMEE
ncbi:hypothetical protein [Micrococcus luteus]|uniref:hypothetical protein n=1 Tax=Micrococcus luteus TaxID=1270 RepID=UPI00332CCCE6